MYVEGTDLVAEWGVLDMTEVGRYTDLFVAFLIGNLKCRMSQTIHPPLHLREDLWGYEELFDADQATRRAFFEMRKAYMSRCPSNKRIVELLKESGHWGLR